MKNKTLHNMAQVAAYTVDPQKRLFSANHDEIYAGLTTDVYFIRTRELLHHLNLEQTPVATEIFAGRPGVLSGVAEVKNLLAGLPIEVWSLPEGTEFAEKQILMRIIGVYDEFGIYETALLGMLASSSGWATAARQCRQAAGDKKVICFGARHVHPAVAPVMERAAVVGGADGASCILGAKLVGQQPRGTVPHAVMLIVGDTLQVADVYRQVMPPDAPVIMLVDTFKDEAEEALRLAQALGEKLQGIRLDTAGERGGVTPGLVREVKGRLQLAGHFHVEILVSGGITPNRMGALIEAGADAFGVGSYISGATAIDMTMDIKEVNQKPLAKRGRIPGLTPATGLVKIM